ncbi:hypothetical protein LCGC14_1076930 [marine sediment metagenome]|uniref:Uncharacterized protein n=1 Tax=marine sediment metagenome TaxID=412755 RepID=A0A0F9PZM3_9ZZZZ
MKSLVPAAIIGFGIAVVLVIIAMSLSSGQSAQDKCKETSTAMTGYVSCLAAIECAKTFPGNERLQASCVKTSLGQ